ncbi:hypothetical protein [Priestia megaterium]|uniref:hypothetical protein n=1 Tax=Priestia megaterium TaxID=1404 RepID=UPI001649E73F|nr:hypothetical protein [Priestia megaterium]
MEEESGDIGGGVEEGLEGGEGEMWDEEMEGMGGGEEGLMFGYGCNERKELMAVGI